MHEKLDETPELEVGQVYSDDRSGDQFELIYVDRNVYIVQERKGSHRFGKRDDFDKNVAAGRYKLCPDEDSFAQTAVPDDSASRDAIDFEELEGIGQTGADNLREAGIVTENDVYRATDEEILAVSWVGEKGLHSIKRAVN